MYCFKQILQPCQNLLMSWTWLSPGSLLFTGPQWVFFPELLLFWKLFPVVHNFEVIFCNHLSKLCITSWNFGFLLILSLFTLFFYIKTTRALSSGAHEGVAWWWGQLLLNLRNHIFFIINLILIHLWILWIFLQFIQTI